MNDECKHDHIHSKVLAKTGYWGSKGAGCIIVAKSTGRVLIPMRSCMVLEPYTWGVFGGAIDPKEDEREAVCRELYEEAGKKVKKDTLEELYVYEDNTASFKYTTYIVHVEDEFLPILNWENKTYNWFKFDEWPSPLHYGLEAILTDPASLDMLRTYCYQPT